MEISDLIPDGGTYCGLVAQARGGIGGALIEKGLEQLRLPGLRAALGAPDLLEHNFLGLGYGLILYGGIKKDIGQDAQELIQVIAVTHNEISRIVVPGETVDVSTQVFDLSLDIVLCPFFGPGENQVFQKVGKPLFRGTLTRVPGAD